MAESELVKKVRKAMDDCFARDVGPDGIPLYGGIHADKDAVARAAIKTVLLGLMEHWQNPFLAADMMDFARANGIDLEQSDGS